MRGGNCLLCLNTSYAPVCIHPQNKLMHLFANYAENAVNSQMFEEDFISATGTDLAYSNKALWKKSLLEVELCVRLIFSMSLL